MSAIGASRGHCPRNAEASATCHRKVTNAAPLSLLFIMRVHGVDVALGVLAKSKQRHHWLDEHPKHKQSVPSRAFELLNFSLSIVASTHVRACGGACPAPFSLKCHVINGRTSMLTDGRKHVTGTMIEDTACKLIVQSCSRSLRASAVAPRSPLSVGTCTRQTDSILACTRSVQESSITRGRPCCMDNFCGTSGQPFKTRIAQVITPPLCEALLASLGDTRSTASVTIIADSVQQIP